MKAQVPFFKKFQCVRLAIIKMDTHKVISTLKATTPPA